MSPEERAKALFPLAFGETLTLYQTALRERIATAIREAEDAAYERAAIHIETEIGSVSPSWVPDLVRELKSQEP